MGKPQIGKKYSQDIYLKNDMWVHWIFKEILKLVMKRTISFLKNGQKSWIDIL